MEAAAEGPAASFPASRGGTPRLAISLGQFSSAGVEPENQDFHGAIEPAGAELASKGIALAIADGISTSRLGAAAAETAVKTFLTDYFCTSAAWSVQTSAERVIAATNAWMHAQNTAAGRASDETREAGLICTFSAVVLKSRSAHLFHVGDGRIARIAGGRIEPLTEPHRVALGGGETCLARALGMNRHVEIDYRCIPLQPGDVFVLSTDGVHDRLPDAAMARIVASFETRLRDAHFAGSSAAPQDERKQGKIPARPEERLSEAPQARSRRLVSKDAGAAAVSDPAATSLDAVAERIVRAALAAGSDDNLTVQLVRIDSLPGGELSELVEAGTLPPAPLLKAGDRFEGYTVLRQLHAGARSHVYLARDEASGGRVALKVPSTETAQDPRHAAALQLEEWAMRRLSHQNLLRAAPQRGARRHLFSAAEYVEGQSLVEWMADNPRPDLARVRDIVRQIASGLLAMHRREMIHRDLRPHNVLVDADGTVKIIDFGSVSVAGLNEIAPPEEGEAAYAGTLQYGAPELYRGLPATPASDLYSLGTIAYQMLTGALPYGTKLPSAAAAAGSRAPRYLPARGLNPEVPEWMDAALAKAVALEPARRYAELSEFTYDLAHPNHALAAVEPLPLLRRGTAGFWRMLAGLLALALAVSILTRPDVTGPTPTQQQETRR